MNYLVVFAGKQCGECWSEIVEVADAGDSYAIKTEAVDALKMQFGDMADCYFISRIERIE